MMKHCRHLIRILNERALDNTYKARPHFYLLGLFLLILYPGFYFFNQYVAHPTGYDSLPMRMSVAVCGVLLLVEPYWPALLKKHTPFILHAILLYAFPFFFSYMLVLNADSTIWQINELIGLILLAFFVDWVTYLLLALTGIVAAWYCAHLFHISLQDLSHLPGTFLSYAPLLVYFLLFARQQRSIAEESADFYQAMKLANHDLEQRVAKSHLLLEESQSIKETILNNMSHEIRTPAHGIITITDALLEGAFDPKQHTYLLQQLRQNVQRLYRFMSHLLDLSACWGKTMQLNEAPHCLYPLAHEVIVAACSMYPERVIMEEITPALQETAILCDPERIRQLYTNVLSNALNFAPKELPIKVRFFSTTLHDQPAIGCDVIDQGVGIPDSEHAHIFEPFVESSRTKTKAGGRGLGLAVCKKIVEAHQGSIVSLPSEKGVIIRIILPLRT